MAFDFNGGKPTKPNNYNSPYNFGDEQRTSTSKGFSNAPVVKDQPNYPINPHDPASSFGPSYGSQSGPQKRKTPSQRAYRNNYFIPWRTLGTVLGIIGIIILLVIFSEEISYFISQLLAWVILLAAAVLIVKWLIFGGRR